MDAKILYTLVIHGEGGDYKIVASYPVKKDVSNYMDIVINTVKDFKSVEDEKISITRDKYDFIT